MEIYLQFIIKVITTLLYEEVLVFATSTCFFLYVIFIYKFKKEYSFLFKLFILIIPVIFIFYQYSFLPEYFRSIGRDSLIEVKNPEFAEVIFYIKTFLTSIFDFEILKRNRFWLVLFSAFTLSVAIFFIINYLLKNKKLDILKTGKFFNLFFVFIILFSFYNAFKLANNFFSAGQEIAKFEKNIIKNSKNIKSIKNKENNLLVVTYIGESTSALHTSLYGYPIETTPWLKEQSKNKRFLKFDKVYSEHTHTTPSLMNSLSLCLENCLITKKDGHKYFFPLIDIINNIDIDTYLYSSQGDILTSRLLFRTNKVRDFAYNLQKQKEEKLQGDKFIPSIRDHEYFNNTYCKNDEIFLDKKSKFVFLHSYAGHGAYGGYTAHIPKKFNISYPAFINKKNFLGKDHSNFNLTKEYDSTIKYIDYSLSNTIGCTFTKSEKHNKPIIFIYFSDHGESPASGKGHDSSRLNYEMIHIPFFIYFNESAYDLYKEKFSALEKIKKNKLSSKIIMEIILYLFEIDVSTKHTQKTLYEWKNFPYFKSDYIVHRELLNGKDSKVYTFWNDNLNIQKAIKEKNFKDEDVSIRLWQMNNYLNQKKLLDKENISNLVCQHRANSFMLMFKSSISNGCFETDVLFFKDRTISSHSESLDTDLIFDDFLKSNYQKNTVWMDAKNIHNVKNCGYAYNWLKKNSYKFVSVLIETPTISIKNIDQEEWLNCINKINNIANVEVAYYLDTHLSKKCSEDILSNMKNSKNCDEFYLDIYKILENTEIRSLTFDYQSGYEAVKANSKLNDLKWNIWNVNSFHAVDKLILNKNIGILLFENNKNLSNLN